MKSSFAFLLLAFTLFFATSSPGIGTEDSGELAGGARLLTMVHAPGYPLYLLLGKIATMLSSEPGRGLVLLSVLSGALAVGLMHRIITLHLGSAAAAAAAVSMIFCRAFWQASTEIEVYALQSLLITAILGALLHLQRKRDARARNLLGFILGLTLTHHMGLIIHLPVLFLYAWYLERDLKKWVAPACCGAAALSLYLVLLVLSARPDLPVIAWEPITSLGQLLYVMTGAGFKKLLFAVPITIALENVITFPFVLLLWFPVLSALLALVGLHAAYRRNMPFAALLVSMIGITIFHAANYDVLDPHIFLMPAVPVMALFVAYGFAYVSEHTAISQRYQGLAVAVIFLTALSGKIAEGDYLHARYNTLPSDIAHVIFDAHDGSDDIVWTDWKFYPVLRYFQAVDGLGPRVRLDFDSTSESPGTLFEEGRTYTMRASAPLGALYPLVMTDLHWKIESGPVTSPLRNDTPVLSFGGIDIIAIDTPRTANPGRPINVNLFLRRGAGPASDTVVGHLSLMRHGRPRVSSPFSLLHWHIPPPELARSITYVEPIQTFVPTSHKNETASGIFSLQLWLESADTRITLPLGDIALDGN